MKEIQTNQPDAMPGDAAGHVDDEFGGFTLADVEPDGVAPTITTDEAKKIVIDDEFKTLIPSQTAEERRSLETSLRTEGCRDALVVWPQPDGTAILLDGHTRREICDEHGIPYAIVSARRLFDALFPVESIVRALGDEEVAA